MSWGKINNVGHWRVIAAGAVGGLAGSYVMNQFQSLLSKGESAFSSGDDKKSSQSSQSGENATVKSAEAISEAVGAGEIADENKDAVGTAIHYAFGTFTGAVYGALVNKFPAVSSGYGALYGSTVWLLGDEAAVPALRLAPPPTQSPFSTHANALASHCVYGFVTDLVMRAFITKVWPRKLT